VAKVVWAHAGHTETAYVVNTLEKKLLERYGALLLT